MVGRLSYEWQHPSNGERLLLPLLAELGAASTGKEGVVLILFWN